jgi:hypothetical protein
MVTLSINIPKLTKQTGVSYGSTRRTLMKHVHLHPCKNTSVQEQKEKDTSSVLNTARGLQA